VSYIVISIVDAKACATAEVDGHHCVDGLGKPDNNGRPAVPNVAGLSIGVEANTQIVVENENRARNGPPVRPGHRQDLAAWPGICVTLTSPADNSARFFARQHATHALTGQQLTRGTTKNGTAIGDWGKKSPPKPDLPYLFPRFGVQANVALCTPLQRKTLIYQ
jgi:hypothetical protein